MQLPDYLKNTTLPDFTDRLGSNLGTRAQPHVSIEGDRLTLVDANGDTEPVLTRDQKTGDPYLDCVIIDAGDVASKIYYGKAYDPKAAAAPPACWSDNGVGPSVNCNEPQALTCTPDPDGKHGCKWSVWGSGRAREGSTTVPPACSKVQKIALLIPGDEIQFLLRVPPASLEGLAAYNAKFKGHPFSMRDVMTRISINNKTLSFVGLGFIDQAVAEQRNAILAAKKTDALVGRGDKPRGGTSAPALPAPESARPLALEAAAPIAPIPQQPSLPPVQSAPTTESAPSQAPTRRRRKAAEDPQQAVQNTAVPVAPFRQAEPAANGSFGIASPAAPNADLEAALKGVFG